MLRQRAAVLLRFVCWLIWAGFSLLPLAADSQSARAAAEVAQVNRLASAYNARDFDAAVAHLTSLAKTFPDAVSRLNPRVISLLIVGADIERGDAFALYEALYDARWRPPLWGDGGIWYDFAAMLLERGQIERARQVARLITDPRSMIAMRADRRFDLIVIADPARFDAEAAARATVESLRAAVERAPNVLEPVVALSSSLLTANRCGDALEVVDAARARAASLSAEHQPFVDSGENFIWILNNRARALWCLERWDEAVGQYQQAAVLTENGRTNVSQVINLADVYVRLHRPADALRALESVGNTSPYGAMQREWVRLQAATQINDRRIVNGAMSYLRSHQDDAIATYQTALVVTDDMDEAARVLVRRLEDPKLRREALEELQIYAPVAAPVVLEWHERRASLRQRPDVRAAVERYGRIESYEYIRALDAD